MNARQLRRLMQDVEAMLVDFRKEHNLPPDADLAECRRTRLDPTIDEFLCPSCSDFVASSGCPKHPNPQQKLPL